MKWSVKIWGGTYLKCLKVLAKLEKMVFLKVKALKDIWCANVGGVFCTYTPIELIRAAGAAPVVLCGKMRRQ